MLHVVFGERVDTEKADSQVERTPNEQPRTEAELEQSHHAVSCTPWWRWQRTWGTKAHWRRVGDRVIARVTRARHTLPCFRTLASDQLATSIETLSTIRASTSSPSPLPHPTKIVSGPPIRAFHHDLQRFPITCSSLFSPLLTRTDSLDGAFKRASLFIGRWRQGSDRLPAGIEAVDAACEAACAVVIVCQIGRAHV